MGQPINEEPPVPATPPAGPPAPGAPPANGGTPTGTDRWAGFQWDGNVDNLPTDVAKVIRDARADAGKERTSAKATAAQEARTGLVQDIGKALGLVNDNVPLTAEQLKEQLGQYQQERDESDAQAAAAQVELQVFRRASALGANAEKLLDSRTFCDKIDNLQPRNLAEFGTMLDAEIAAAVKQDPTLRAGGGPARIGADINGGGGGSDRPGSVREAYARKYAGT